MKDDKVTIYSLIVHDNRSAICKTRKRESYEDLRTKIPRILELSDRLAPSTIAEKVKVSIKFVTQILYQKELAARGDPLASRIYELARLKDYQSIVPKKPVGFRVNALARELGQNENKIKKVIKDADLEQTIDDQIKEDVIDVVFSGEYYNYSADAINYEQLARDVSTQPNTVKRFFTELNLHNYLRLAFKAAKNYNLPADKIGKLLVYSDEGAFKDRINRYNYTGLAKHIDWPFKDMNIMVDILKEKDSVVNKVTT